jgi:hypothetical protein
MPRGLYVSTSTDNEGKGRGRDESGGIYIRCVFDGDVVGDAFDALFFRFGGIVV